jgi:hypothetical protein
MFAGGDEERRVEVIALSISRSYMPPTEFFANFLNMARNPRV